MVLLHTNCTNLLRYHFVSSYVGLRKRLLSVFVFRRAHHCIYLVCINYIGSAVKREVNRSSITSKYGVLKAIMKGAREKTRRGVGLPYLLAQASHLVSER